MEIKDFCKIGRPINDKFIEEAQLPVECEAFAYSIHGNFYSTHYSADGDEDGSFQEAIEKATSEHFHIWERDHQEKDVTSHTTECIKSTLEEYDLWGIPENIDIILKNYYPEWMYNPQRVNRENHQRVIDALNRAADSLTWLQSESLQLFFQTTNPCCWDGKPPQERYGKNWVADTETRLILIIKKDKIRESVLKRIYNKGHTLIASRNHYSMGRTAYGYLTEYDQYGDEYLKAREPIEII